MSFSSNISYTSSSRVQFEYLSCLCVSITIRALQERLTFSNSGVGDLILELEEAIGNSVAPILGPSLGCWLALRLGPSLGCRLVSTVVSSVGLCVGFGGVVVG